MGRGVELKYPVPKWATKMLVDFVNVRDFGDFQKRWRWHQGMDWRGGETSFKRVQALVCGVWRGKRDGATEVAWHLGLGMPKGDKVQTYKRPDIRPNWKTGTLNLSVFELNELVWLTLLHESPRLAICKNSLEEHSGVKCPTPYFLKYRPQSKFCSDLCAIPSQREAKRRYWEAHKDELRPPKRLLSETKSLKRPTEGPNTKRQ